MKTSRLLITTAAILVIAAPAASARPAMDPSSARPHKPQASTPASIVAHKEQLSTEQYLASRGMSGTSAPAQPLADRSLDTDDGFPVAFVLLGLTIPLGIGIGMLAARPVRSYVAAHRRPPASAA